MATRKSASPPPVEYASAMDKIRDEMAKSQDNYTQVVGEYLTGYLLNHPEAEEKIMAEGKSIAGSLKAMEAEARKVKQGNVAVLDDRTAFGIVLQYYGLNAGDVSETAENAHGTEKNVTAEATGEATSSDPPQAAAHLPLKGKAFGETGKTAAPDPFDLDALLGVM